MRPDAPFGRRLASYLAIPSLPEDYLRLLVAYVAMHDMGKAAHGFQDKIRLARPAPTALTGHVLTLLHALSATLHQSNSPLAILDTDMRSHYPDQMESGQLLQEIYCHHGRPWDTTDNPAAQLLVMNSNIWNPTVDRDPGAYANRLWQEAKKWVALSGPINPLPRPLTPEASQLLAGIVTLSDWLGSTTRFFPFTPSAEQDPKDYWQLAQDRAEKACRAAELIPRPVHLGFTGRPLLDLLFPNIFGQASAQATDLQLNIANQDLPNSGALFCIESDTGSGKTEAALTLYARLRESGHVSGLVFALPTRATALGMHRRIQSLLKTLYPENSQPTLVLAIGGQDHGPLTSSASPWSSPSPTEPDAVDSPSIPWASEGSKKFLSAEIVVGTVDQVLLAGMPVKHAHLRLAALSRHLIVVDEVHAYDRYMTAILSNLLRLHTTRHGYALLMSATLAISARLQYALTPPTRILPMPLLPEAIARPYPLVSIEEPPHLGSRRVREIPLSSPPGRSRTISWSLTDKDKYIQSAIKAAQSGARVCVLHNTVTGVLETHKAIAAKHASLLWRPNGSSSPAVYHSRYTPPDRSHLDASVLADFGPGSTTQGTILIATQVIEQSLDVDFDYLIADLAPVDLLIQRLGRLHRHIRLRRPPGYATPVLSILAPDPVKGFGPYLKGGKPGHGWGRVYEDLADLELTLRLVLRHPQIHLPNMARQLIEEVYHPEISTQLASISGWGSYDQKRQGVSINRHGMGMRARLPFDKRYSDLTDLYNRTQEESIHTRLGDDSIKLLLPSPVPSYHGQSSANHVLLPYAILANLELKQQPIAGIKMNVGPAETKVALPNGATLTYAATGWSWTYPKSQDKEVSV